VRSSGSIGGGTRAYDNPDVRSSGSIGDGPRAYDTPEHQSEGSIGGRTPVERKVRRDGNLDEPIEDEDRQDEEIEEPTYNDRSVKSGGSFGKR